MSRNQYHAWIATRTSDDRRQWPIEKLPLDLWFLIHWVWHLTDSAEDLFSHPIGKRRCPRFVLCSADLERLGKKPRFDRSILPGLDLDDTLWAGHGILYLPDPCTGNRSRLGPSI